MALLFIRNNGFKFEDVLNFNKEIISKNDTYPIYLIKAQNNLTTDILTDNIVYVDYLNCNEKISINKLQTSFIKALEISKNNDLESVCFPLFFRDITSYHLQEVAYKTIKDFLKSNELDVYIMFDYNQKFNRNLKLISKVDKFIVSNYPKPDYFIQTNSIQYTAKERFTPAPCESFLKKSIDIELEETFCEKLFKIIDKKGLDDIEVYKKANINRKLFSKIKSDKDYNPSKKTVIAFVIALKLNLKEADELLNSAGYSLSKSHVFDVIIEYFIKNKKYDIYEINATLFKYDLQLLGS